MEKTESKEIEKTETIKDELNWTDFLKNSPLNINDLPNKILNFNRLICHTNNFFLIAGYGAFTKGYSMIIPKNSVSSFAHLNEKLINEFLWFKNFTKKLLLEVYPEYNVAIFEHGLCSCLGGLDRAHLHFMLYQNKNQNDIIISINKSLARRKVGNLKVKFGDYTLDKPDDLNFFFKENNINKKNKDFLITGKQFTLQDIRSELSIEDYPSNLYKSVLDGNPYIFFDSGQKNSSFITLNNIETQFGREIVFNTDYKDTIEIESLLKVNKINYKENTFYWRWQDCRFDENILSTIKEIGTYLNINKEKNINKYNLVSF